jgi:Cu(I)/Ag(I) efflux system membrane fusion protein
MKKKIIFLLIILLTAGGGYFVFLKQKPVSQSIHAGHSATAKYFCPMHPHYTSDKPGDCPICHMRLVPMESMGSKEALAEHEKSKPLAPESVCALHDCPMLKEGQACPMLVLAESGEKLECPVCKSRIDTAQAQQAILSKEGYAPVLISPKKQQLIGIQTSLVEKKRIEKAIRAVGKIAYDPELYQAQAEYIQSIRSLKNSPGEKEWAAKLVESARTKLVLMGLNPAMIEAIERSGSPDKSLLVSVPGAQAWVYANIYEYEIPLVKVGDGMEVEVPSSPENKLRGQIQSIDTLVDPVTRSVRVRATVHNDKGFLKPDLFVNVSLKVDLGEVLAVPREAVFVSGRTTLVFLDKGDGLFEPKIVIVGQKAEKMVEIREGLKEGQRVITNGNFLVDSESRLKAALSGMGGPSGGGEHSGHQHG